MTIIANIDLSKILLYFSDHGNYNQRQPQEVTQG